jgi:ABC-2 type transport system permease protein
MGAWCIISKDLRLLVRDRRALVTLLALPMIFIAIIGMTTGQLLGWQADNNVLKIGVVDGSNKDPLVQKILQKLVENKRSVKTTDYPNQLAAEQALDARDCVTVVVIGPKFAENVDQLGIQDVLNTKKGPLTKGLSAFDMQSITRESFAGIGDIVNELVFSSTLRVVVPHVMRDSRVGQKILQCAGIPLKNFDNPEEDKAKAEPAIQVEATPQNGQGKRGNPVYNALVPAYTVMFSFFMINIMSRSFLTERETGTLRRLRISPLRPPAIMFGKTVPFYLVSVIQSILLFACGKVLFGMSWGAAPWLLIPVIVCTSLAATTLGLLMAAVVKSDSQVSAYATSLVIIMAGISGCFMPREWLPEIMLKISLITPHAWSLMAYEQLLARQFVDVTVVRHCCLMLLTYSAIYFALGWWRFRSMD